MRSHATGPGVGGGKFQISKKVGVPMKKTCVILVISAVAVIHLMPQTAFAGTGTDQDHPEVLGLVLTWQQDPTSTMTIDWHTQDHDQAVTLEYKKVGGDEWMTASGEKSPFPFSDRIINRVELTGLQAGTEYRFRFHEESAYRKFRTMPENAIRPIRFAAGGDVRHTRHMMELTNRQAASYKPDFIVWGGDLAYADGREDRLYRWHEYMEVMMNTLVTRDGRVIPVLAGIGNHEVLGGYYRNDGHSARENVPPYTQTDESRRQIAPYYFDLFAFPGQPGYGVLDFGDYMSILLLDTDHANPIEGEQTEWLKKVLAERQHIPHIFPNYHVPAYPSVRNPEGSINKRLRETWVPLFEQAGVRVAFENHDHAYKRTYPMRNGEIDPNGIVYIGDGAWGVYTRPTGGGDDPDFWAYHGKNPWYLKRASSERHFIIGTVHGPHQHFLMINEDGKVIDEYPRTPHLDIDRTRLAEPWENKERN
ncbi:MAG: metallophosphoesterase family protein [Balneolaceae bacterium]|nr:MAG: metallophosphoesterase family protein [Balneolaceae bacterium]